MSSKITSNLYDLPKSKTRTEVPEPEAEDFVNAEKPLERTARLSVDVPCSMLKKLKIHAIQRDKTVREVVVQLLEREGFAG